MSKAMDDAMKRLRELTPLEAECPQLPEGAKQAKPWSEAEVVAKPQREFQRKAAKPVYEFESLRIQRVTRRITKL